MLLQNWPESAGWVSIWTPGGDGASLPPPAMSVIQVLWDGAEPLAGGRGHRRQAELSGELPHGAVVSST